MQRQLNAGGTLAPEMLYVERDADLELPRKLLDGEYCFVLAPRQIGKSSLRVRAQQRLKQQGVSTASIDLSLFGCHLSPDEWYFGLIQELSQELGYPEDPQCFWRQDPALSPLHRWIRFLRQRVAGAARHPIVIFVDELDVLLSLPFSRDDFLGALRALYNLRAEEPACKRLTFCLLGVASPGELMADPARTPFNVGHRIILEDFNRSEMAGFAPALCTLPGETRAWLDAIYDWTSGHPYMTQRVCERLLSGTDQPEWTANPVAEVELRIQELFLRRGRTDDPNLSYAERRLDHASNRPRLRRLLAEYRRLLHGHTWPTDHTDPIQAELELCGLVASRNMHGEQRVTVRNRVVRSVFDLDWLADKEEIHELAAALRKWKESGRSADHLLRGLELERARSWATEHARELTGDESAYLLASMDGVREAAEQQRLASEALVERERRERLEYRTRILRRVLAGFTAGLAALLALSVFLYLQVQRARQMTRAALKTQALAWSKRPGYHLSALVAGMRVVHEQVASGKYVTRDWEGLLGAAAEVVPSITFEGHSDAVNSVAFSPDGKHLLSASWDGTARVWDIASRKSIQSLSGHGPKVHFAAYSPDGRQIATCGEDGTAKLWDTASGQLMLILKGHSASVLQVRYSADGQKLVTASKDKTARIWESTTGKLLKILPGHTSEVTSAAFSSDGHLVVTGASDLELDVVDTTARVWDVEKGTCLKTFQTHSGVNFVDFTADNKKIIIGGDRGLAWLLDIANDNKRVISGRHFAGINSVQYSNDEHLVLTTSRDRTTRIWAADTGARLLDLEGHADEVRFAVFSPNQRYVATASTDHSVRLYDLRDRSIKVIGDYNPNTLRFPTQFSPDGKAIGSGEWHSLQNVGVAKIFDAETLEVTHQLWGHNGHLMDISFSPDGSKIATAGSDHLIRLWDAKKGHLLSTLAGHRHWVTQARFSADSRLLLTTSHDKHACIWDVGQAAEVKCFSEPDEHLTYAYFIDNDRKVVSRSLETATTLMWDLSGHLVFKAQNKFFGITSACKQYWGYWPSIAVMDNTIIYGSCNDLLLWDYSAQREQMRFSVGADLGIHTMPGEITVYKDKRRIVASVGGTVARIFDTRDGSTWLSIDDLDEPSFRFTPSPDGNQLASGTMSNTVQIYDFDWLKLYRFACRALRNVSYIRGVTADELAEATSSCTR